MGPREAAAERREMVVLAVGGGIDSEAPDSEFLNDTIYGNSALGGSGQYCHRQQRLNSR